MVTILKGTVDIIFSPSLTSLSLASNYVLTMLAAFRRLEFIAVSLNLITSIMASSGRGKQEARRQRKKPSLWLFSEPGDLGPQGGAEKSVRVSSP